MKALLPFLVAVLALSPAIAAPIDDLASPDQAVRDQAVRDQAAAQTLRAKKEAGR